MDTKDATSAGKKPGPKPLQSSNPKTQYLILYNVVSALLWLVVLGRVLVLVPLVGFGRVYPGLGQFVKFTQTLAVMEILHSLFGVVRAPLLTTAMQVASRLLLVWPVVDQFPYLAKSTGYSTMLIAWSVTEVIRYSYFVFTLSGYQPSFISWLRYNTFYVLYPLGISSECWMMWSAIEPAEEKMPAMAWFFKIMLGVYVPGSYILFTHMMAQRRKVMRGKQVQKVQ